jgi:hypothetical protein
LPLTKYLQNVNIDLKKAVEYAEHVNSIMKDIRTTAESEFHLIFREAEDICSKLRIPIILPRVVQKQVHRHNIINEDPEAYFRISSFIPFVDTFISELNERFLMHREVLNSFQVLLPQGEFETPSAEEEQALLCLHQKYVSDINHSQMAALGELRVWYKTVSRLAKNPPQNALESLTHCNEGIIYPFIRKMLQVMATLPVTTCAAERFFYTLRYLKNYLRSTTSETRLNGLALLYIHSDISVPTEDVLNILALKSRRMDFK